MRAQETKLQAVENDLKQLMADLSRATQKAQEAIEKNTPKAEATITDKGATRIHAP